MGERLGITFIKHNQIFGKAYFHWSAYTLDALLEAQMLLNGINYWDETDTIITKMVHNCYSNINFIGLMPEELLYANSDPVKKQIFLDDISKIMSQPNPLKTLFQDAKYSKFLYVGGFEPQYLESELNNLSTLWPGAHQLISKFDDLPDISKLKISRTMGLVTFDPARFDEYDNYTEESMTMDFDNRNITTDLFYLYEKESYLEYDFNVPFEDLPKWVESSTFDMMEIPFDKLNYAIAILRANYQHQYGYFRYDDETVLELRTD